MTDKSNRRDHFKGMKPNEVYAFTLSGDDNIAPKYEAYDLNNLSMGDTDSGGFLINQVIVDTFNGNHDDITEFSDMVAEIVNEGFPQYCMDVFNCPPERKNIIETSREIVSDKSLFLTKKRYIMHVINNEGDVVDDLKVMGVELIKSDSSIALKAILWEFVNLILDGGSDEQILALRDKTRLEWEDRWTFREMATPLNTGSLHKVMETYEATGSLKGAHYSARAAFFWNELCTRIDKPVSAGEKIGLIYIKHPKSKYIGYPIDMLTPPEWWEDVIFIDYKREWESVNKKIENYLTVLDLDVLSRKQAVSKSMFSFGFG